MSQEELQEAVAASPLFHGCKRYVDSMSVKVFRKGQIVSDRQMGQEILGLVVRGSVEVYSIAMDGREIMLSQLKRGDCFGIINLFTNTELPTVLKCGRDTTLLTIPKKKLLELMKNDKELTLRYACICNEKMQFLIKRIEFLTMQSGRNKLIQYLLMRPEQEGLIGLECSKESLASMLGISRASLFRELACLQERKLIDQEPGGIRIRNREQLETILYEW